MFFLFEFKASLGYRVNLRPLSYTETPFSQKKKHWTLWARLFLETGASSFRAKEP